MKGKTLTLTVAAAMMLFLVPPGGAQGSTTGYEAEANAHAECYQHNLGEPHWSIHEHGSAGAWRNGVDLPLQLFKATVTGTRIADSDQATTGGAWAEDTWDDDVGPGATTRVNALAEAYVGGVLVAVDSDAAGDACPGDPPSIGLPDILDRCPTQPRLHLAETATSTDQTSTETCGDARLFDWEIF